MKFMISYQGEEEDDSDNNGGAESVLVPPPVTPKNRGRSVTRRETMNSTLPSTPWNQAPPSNETSLTPRNQSYVEGASKIFGRDSTRSLTPYQVRLGCYEAH